MTTCTDLVIRLLTSADVDSIARVHRAAFAESGITALGKSISERYYRWQLQQPGTTTILGAERQGQLVGFCLAADSFGSMADFLRAHFLTVSMQLIRRPWALWQFRSQIAAALPVMTRRRRSAAGTLTADRQAVTAYRRGFWLHALAVDPSQRRLGIGGRLMREAETFAVRQGCDHMLLAVVTTNQPAIRLYESEGWSRVPDNAAWRGRMRKPLARRDDSRPTVPTSVAS